jgi:hypothetical protein
MTMTFLPRSAAYKEISFPARRQDIGGAPSVLGSKSMSTKSFDAVLEANNQYVRNLSAKKASSPCRLPDISPF